MAVQMLSQDEIVALLDVVRGTLLKSDMDSREALEVLFQHFRPLVLRTAKQYANLGLEDAIQEGYLSLLSAFHEYDETIGVPFAGYAAYKVRGDVRTAMRRLWRYDERVSYRSGDVSDRGRDGGPPTDLWDEITAESAFAGWDDYDCADIHLLIDSCGLSPRERQAIFSMLAGETCTLLAAKAGVGTETAKTWRKRALHKLRAALGGEV